MKNYIILTKYDIRNKNFPVYINSLLSFVNLLYNFILHKKKYSEKDR